MCAVGIDQAHTPIGQTKKHQILAKNADVLRPLRDISRDANR